MKLIFASQNKHKLRELQQIVGDQFELVSLSEIGITEELPETHSTLEDNALEKATTVFFKLHQPVFAEDTGLEVEVLNGEPGVFSARYAGEQKNADDNIALLLSKLKNETQRSAQFRTVICLLIEGTPFFFEGITKGRIAEEKRGTNGFGYDPVFIPEGYNVTFAEMPDEEKNKISHRSKAIHQLTEFLHNIHTVRS